MPFASASSDEGLLLYSTIQATAQFSVPYFEIYLFPPVILRAMRPLGPHGSNWRDVRCVKIWVRNGFPRPIITPTSTTRSPPLVRHPRGTFLTLFFTPGLETLA